MFLPFFFFFPNQGNKGYVGGQPKALSKFRATGEGCLYNYYHYFNIGKVTLTNKARQQITPVSASMHTSWRWRFHISHTSLEKLHVDLKTRLARHPYPENPQWMEEIPKVSAAQSCENQLKISLIISRQRGCALISKPTESGAACAYKSASVVGQLFMPQQYIALKPILI